MTGIDRRKFIRTTAVAALGAQTMPLLSLSQTEKQLTILHTNDMHSHIEPFSLNDAKYPGLGGMARRSTMIKEVRNQKKHVLLLDAGDIFQGTPYFNYYGGELELKLMSKMGYDASTIGNHEFDAGMVGLSKVLPQASFPFICSNYDFTNTGLEGKTVPYHIIQKGAIKIGIFGLGIDPYGLVPDKLYKGTIYNDPLMVAEEMIQSLQQANCDLIICLSHLGYRYKHNKVSDIVLANKLTGIDLILGGHTHTLLEKATYITNKMGHTTVINQVGWAGIALGRIDVTFNNHKKIIAHISNSQVLCS